MFKIYKGGDCFYQWDLGQRLVISDPEIDKVHFCNQTDDCALVVEVYEENGVRLANVPNILMQTTNNIRVYACIEDGDDIYYAKTMKIFRVLPRSQPLDYVYEETEVKIYDQLLAQIEAMQENWELLDSKEVELASEEANFLMYYFPEGYSKFMIHIENPQPNNDTEAPLYFNYFKPDTQSSSGVYTWETIIKEGYPYCYEFTFSKKELQGNTYIKIDGYTADNSWQAMPGASKCIKTSGWLKGERMDYARFTVPLTIGSNYSIWGIK